ncbi:hypothetical protein QJQ58_06975 [Paenibacillus dendritiformis]|uniref:hypothetical protein n=1 Tax=Paenibacillus dendritiformis TaxID=130049 RepID=UPI00248AF65E|nr:hypothetical protein [Paenibacillus dendritiformis]WGU95994.1 hypothetical protein QJQ58_06975 [Paenibacillus dendritiformis]
MKETLFRMMESKPLDYGRLQHLQEGLTMDPEFVEKQSFQVVGIEMYSSEGYEFGGLWERFGRQTPASIAAAGVLYDKVRFKMLPACIHHSSIALRRS